MIQNKFQNDFMNFNGGLKGFRRKKSVYQNAYDKSGQEKTNKTPKMVENIENC